MRISEYLNKSKYEATVHLPQELKNYFIIHWSISALSFAIVLIVLFVAGLHRSLFVIPLGILTYSGYVTYNYIRVLSGKLIMIQGICESRENDHFKVSNPIFKKSNFMNLFEYYGKSTITIVMDDLKFTVPVGHNFPVKESQTIRVYAFPDDIYQRTDNSFLVNNPLFAKVVKI